MEKQWKQWETLFSWAPKLLQMVTAATKLRCLLLGRKTMTNLDSIWKSRDITLPSKFRLVKAMVFPVVTWDMNHQKGWMPKNGCFWAVVLEKTLGVHWTARRSNQSILKEINPEYSLECWSWSSNILATWCEELTHGKRPWCWERLKAGGEGDNRGWDGWMASPTKWTWVWVNSRSWWWTGSPGLLRSMGSQRVGHYWATELNWDTRKLVPAGMLEIEEIQNKESGKYMG